MKMFRPLAIIGLTTALLQGCGRETAPPGPPGSPLPGLTQQQLADFHAGQTLFDRVFTPEEGLGPLFNENQCAACHSDPTSGGGGGERVTKASRFVPPSSCDRLLPLGGENVRSQATPAMKALGIEEETVPTEATERGRFTPPFLYGLGLVEAIPEETIMALADPEDADGDGISGRPGRSPAGGLGRFGRKGEAETLLEFIDSALRLELGLTTPISPLESGLNGQPLPVGTDPAPDPEVSEPMIRRLVDYVRFLAPVSRVERGPAHRDSVARGEQLFSGLGCAKCHVPSMDTGTSEIGALERKRVFLYSDLLLHDMGPELTDICGVGASPSEVRTEMLMGLRHRSAYLHDGRALDITEAVLRHGGEALAAREAFAALDLVSRQDLLVFLRSL